jgi:hypothetical protein
MSALPLKADILSVGIDVCLVPLHASAEFHNRDTGNFLTSKGS